MTRAELNTDIDTNITNVVTEDGITPAILGAELKVIADYVDQFVVEKTIKITLSSAEILALFTTPKELVPAVSGKLLIPRFLHQKYTHVTTPYTGGATWRIGLGSINTAFAVVSASIGSADNAQAINAFSQAWSTSGTSYEELNIIIGATGSNPTGGDGTMELFLNYLEIDIT